MSAQLPLLDRAAEPSEREKARAELDRMGADPDNEAVFRALQPVLEARYRDRLARIRVDGEDERGETVAYVTADDAWPYLAAHPHVRARLSSANALGPLFVKLPGWKALGYTRSKREGSHANLLRMWAWSPNGGRP